MKPTLTEAASAPVSERAEVVERDESSTTLGSVAGEVPGGADPAINLALIGERATVLGPIACITCGEQVIWVRLNGDWKLLQGGEPHRCVA